MRPDDINRHENDAIQLAIYKKITAGDASKSEQSALFEDFIAQPVYPQCPSLNVVVLCVVLARQVPHLKPKILQHIQAHVELFMAGISDHHVAVSFFAQAFSERKREVLDCLQHNLERYFNLIKTGCDGNFSFALSGLLETFPDHVADVMAPFKANPEQYFGNRSGAESILGKLRYLAHVHPGLGMEILAPILERSDCFQDIFGDAHQVAKLIDVFNIPGASPDIEDRIVQVFMSDAERYMAAIESYDSEYPIPTFLLDHYSGAAGRFEIFAPFIACPERLLRLFERAPGVMMDMASGIPRLQNEVVALILRQPERFSGEYNGMPLLCLAAHFFPEHHSELLWHMLSDVDTFKAVIKDKQTLLYYKHAFPGYAHIFAQDSVEQAVLSVKSGLVEMKRLKANVQLLCQAARSGQSSLPRRLSPLIPQIVAKSADLSVLTTEEAEKAVSQAYTQYCASSKKHAPRRSVSARESTAGVVESKGDDGGAPVVNSSRFFCDSREVEETESSSDEAAATQGHRV